MPKTATPTLTANDITALRKASDEWGRCLLARNFDGLARMYMEDATLMPPNQPAVQGRKAIRQWLDQFPRVSHFRIEHEEVDGRDDLAYVRGTYTMTFQPDGAPNPIEDTGKFLDIRKKQADGSWVWAVDMFSSDNPTT
jgi:ketosteroid isomerase-like protein